MTSLLIGMALGHRLNDGEAVVTEPVKPVRSEMSETRSQGNYRFINPLLECDMATPTLRNSAKQLEADLKSYINEMVSDDMINVVSVYYRDLNNGPWISIGGGQAFSPASLLKVPVLIAALKKAEDERGLMNRSFKFDATVPMDYVDPNIIDEQIVYGKSYTYLELMERMIVNSDNNAKNMLVNIIGDDDIFGVWRDLGVGVPGDDTPEDFLTVREYSSFFRILYNATYLNRELSELALDILSRTVFDLGLQKGLPPNVLLSNKFGERGFADSDVKQLHDCGIVYAGSSPYLICVMTRGRDWQTQADIIGHVSKLVYQAHTGVLPKP